jgi:hypothetical protein
MIKVAELRSGARQQAASTSFHPPTEPQAHRAALQHYLSLSHHPQLAPLVSTAWAFRPGQPEPRMTLGRTGRAKVEEDNTLEHSFSERQKSLKGKHS